MGTAEGVDYSTARPSLTALVAAGKQFAVRYLCWLPNPKAVTRAEALKLWAAGINLILVWETTERAAMGGRGAGRQHAAEAVRQAKALGFPDDVVIYFAVDFNPQPSELSTINAYFDGICEVMPWSRVGVYGGLRTIVAAKDQSWARFLWQTYAWSGGVWHQSAHARQYHNGVTIGGGDLDLDLAMVDFIGQFNADGNVYSWKDIADMDAADVWKFKITSPSLGVTATAEDFLKQGMGAARGVAELKTSVASLQQAVAELTGGVPPISDEALDAALLRVLARLRGEVTYTVDSPAAGKDSEPAPAAVSGG